MRHYCLESSQNGADKREGKTPSREVVITVGGEANSDDNNTYRKDLIAVEMDIEEVPRKKCGEKRCCSANDLVKLLPVTVN